MGADSQKLEAHTEQTNGWAYNYKQYLISISTGWQNKGLWPLSTKHVVYILQATGLQKWWDQAVNL